MKLVIGWDIGGANTKVALIEYEGGNILRLRTAFRYFPIWKYHEELLKLLAEMRDDLIKGATIDAVGLTMTAELADIYRTKRNGVRHILRCTREAFPRGPIFVVDVDAKLMSVEDAERSPLRVAAANWVATAWFVSRKYRNAILIDVGSTTTDIVPVVDGKIAAQGKNDLERLISGELIFTGALRTNVATIVQSVPVKGTFARVSSECFAISADIHLVLGNISEKDYTCESPDSRAKTVDFSLERLARVVCADAEMLGREEILEMARYVYEKQLQQITNAIGQVLSRARLGGRELTAVVTGLGKDFLAKVAARRAGVKVIVDMANLLGEDGAFMAPSVAVAFMVAEKLEGCV